MIRVDESTFPSNVVSVLSNELKRVDSEGDITVVRRRIVHTDGVQAIGVYGAMWQPDEDSFEMRGGDSPGPNEPTIQRYLVVVNAFVKDTDEQRGLAVHSVLASRIRAMLYRDTTLRLALANLVNSSGGYKESVQRWGISSQRLLSNELEGMWLYLSTLEMWIDTVTSKE